MEKFSFDVKYQITRVFLRTGSITFAKALFPSILLESVNFIDVFVSWYV